MNLSELQTELTQIPGAMPVWHGTVDARQWREACEAVREEGGTLVALWGSDERERGAGFAVHVALSYHEGLLCLTLPLPKDQPAYPDVSAIFPTANRMQRAAFDMLGVLALESPDHRQWLRHAAWPADVFPLRKDVSFEFGVSNSEAKRQPEIRQHATTGLGAAETDLQVMSKPNPEPGTDNYPFVPVTGDGVHEIPVGPVHAGTIEPGHFRFSIVGEKVLRLEERLGYKHKGIEKLFERMHILQGARLAGRVSGDSTVAYAWAYAMAVESITGVTPPRRALWLRALLLERERMMNHLGDLGFLGNDAALSFGLAQFSRLKEDMLRLNQALFGHRYLMDAIIPGGVACDLDDHGAAQVRDEIAVLEREIPVLRNIYDEHAGLQDRFITTGRVAPDLAARLGLSGLAGRASGQAWDLRVEFPCVPYDELDVRMATHRNGDVAARAIVRFDEIMESLRLLGLILDALPPGDVAVPIPDAPEGALGIGWVEGWRGEVLIAIHSGGNNSIHRAHAHDPSWQNWPLLEHAVIGNIVPDFPLINKSFNLSYSGHDL